MSCDNLINNMMKFGSELAFGSMYNCYIKKTKTLRHEMKQLNPRTINYFRFTVFVSLSMKSKHKSIANKK